LDQSVSEGFTAPPDAGAPPPPPPPAELVPLQQQAPAQKPMMQVRLRRMGPMVDPEKEAHTNAFAAAQQAPAQAQAPQAPAAAGPAQSQQAQLLAAMQAQLQAAVAAKGKPAKQGYKPQGYAFGTQSIVAPSANAPQPAAPAAPARVIQSALSRAVAPYVAQQGRSVTVYVAPWCAWCKKGAPQFGQLADGLRSRGYSVKIVVGQAPREQLDAFAAQIGPDAVVDPAGSNPLRGVPAYIVADNGQVTATHMGLFGSAAEAQAWAESH
jgi:hypothetical protein